MRVSVGASTFARPRARALSRNLAWIQEAANQRAAGRKHGVQEEPVRTASVEHLLQVLQADRFGFGFGATGGTDRDQQGTPAASRNRSDPDKVSETPADTCCWPNRSLGAPNRVQNRTGAQGAPMES